MYSKQQVSKLRQEFWATFGQYMSPVLSEEGEKINWINYKTGEKDISFRMQADNNTALIAIVLTHKDPGIRQIYFEQFQQFKNLFESTTGEEWNWQLHHYDENKKTSSRIFKEKNAVSIFEKEHWPQLISFFKPRIIALDKFWSSVKYAFESLH